MKLGQLERLKDKLFRPTVPDVPLCILRGGAADRLWNTRCSELLSQSFTKINLYIENLIFIFFESPPLTFKKSENKKFFYRGKSVIKWDSK